MIIRMCPTVGLKGQKANSPGHRPGYRGCTVPPCKGKRMSRRRRLRPRLLPFQGDDNPAFIPRALPWADCLLAFQAVLRKHTIITYLYQLVILLLLRKKEIQYAEHHLVACFGIAYALEWEPHGERTVIGSQVCHGGTCPVGIDHCGEGRGLGVERSRS